MLESERHCLFGAVWSSGDTETPISTQSCSTCSLIALLQQLFQGHSAPSSILGPGAKGGVNPCPSSLKNNNQMSPTVISLIKEVGEGKERHINIPNEGGMRQMDVGRLRRGAPVEEKEVGVGRGKKWPAV